MPAYGRQPPAQFFYRGNPAALGTIAVSVVQSFFLAFTDFGIPASIGGRYTVVAGLLYNTMLGSLPDFHQGSVIALCMLLPSIVSILL
ncbi:MAG: hypothetical protein L6V86_03195 [Treponema sp.]|nr:MAG: hypothetical protein L6V86_03195 [Treponema sp.]